MTLSNECDQALERAKRTGEVTVSPFKRLRRSKSCLYMPTMRCTHKECIKANGEAK